ncbi:MAG: hypothetical protein QOD08_939 [Gaiellaceae bacterium]|nr:hypothetical protein [Gaiellaceae bacterium]
MTRVLVLVSFAAAVLVLGVSPAGATRECNGLQVCVRVAGPWVVVPTGGAAGRTVRYHLSCPRGFVVGGTDAELSRRGIDVRFEGRMGGPVNPGVTTRRAAVFLAWYVGPAGGTATFRPHAGCMPAGGGGAAIPTARTVYPPSEATVWRVRNVHVTARTKLVVASCAAGERLVGASHAVGFLGRRPPTATAASSVRATRAVSGRRVRVAVSARSLPGVRPVVQVAAVCAGGA